MADTPSRLEWLPNEILIDIFQELDARDIYRAFDHLNSRFNRLIQSLNQLSLTLSPSDPDEPLADQVFSSQISTLIANERANVILGYFPNVHRLILHWLPDNVLDKLAVNILPDLEYLYINSPELSSAYWDFSDHIFTNGFPQLKFCSLSELNIDLTTYLQWHQTPVLTVLKTGRVNLFAFHQILSICPNLQVFEFTLVQSHETPTHFEHHGNIKSLVIKHVHFSTLFDAHILNMYLLCVPNLKRLSIHLTDRCLLQTQGLLEFDGLGSIIDLHLSKLRRVEFYLSVYLNASNQALNEMTLGYIEENFQRMQNNRYQSKLIINRINVNSFDDLYL